MIQVWMRDYYCQKGSILSIETGNVRQILTVIYFSIKRQAKVNKQPFTATDNLYATSSYFIGATMDAYLHKQSLQSL
jgi:hypothetical protein